ncbi:MAG: peptide ABC transporter substrate-binding protein [Candidatus Eremiobacteraeota bacterium]|nr:peptide ABC transporter substrate-binding protein [Candidatus Eremiobacteraeota bacterium]MBC5823072.1 peptide ABC transporter substrate-binding protein [Candidatus Eremiobacteraeota bacterium]
MQATQAVKGATWPVQPWGGRCRWLAATMIFALAGCVHQPTARAAAQSVLIVAQTREPISLNPILEGGYVGNELGSLCFSYLLRIDDRMRLGPEIAREVPSLQNGGISRDGMTITYRLRRGVRWDDGAPLTSADVVFSYHAIMNPRNLVPAGRIGYDRIASVRALDPYTVRVVLARPFSALLSYFFASDENYAILPAHVLARYSDVNHVAFDGRPVCSGPYSVTGWQRGDHLTFAANPTYWRGRPKIGRLVLRFVPNRQTAVDQLRTGEAGAYFDADASAFPQLSSLRGITLARTPTGDFATMQFNTTASPTNDVRVRRAIVLASNFPAIVPKVTQGAYTFAHATRGWFGWAYAPAIHIPAYDPRAAAALLDAAGWTRGLGGVRFKDGRRLQVEMIMRNDEPAIIATAVYLQQALAELGIVVSIKTYIPPQFVEVTGPAAQGRFNVLMERQLANLDPDASNWVACDPREPHGNNYARYCNPAVDRLDADALRTFDRTRRLADYAAVQRLIAADLPVIALWEADELDAYTTRLHGFSSSYQSPFWNVAAWSLSGSR